MKLKRKKTGDRKYDLIDTEVGDVVATAVQTGERGRDDYPWEWSLTDINYEFGDSGLSTGGSRESLKDIVDFVESAASKYGITYRRDLKAQDEAKAAEEKKAASALRKMVKKLDGRNKRTSQGYVTNRDELIAILSEVSKLVSVSIVEEERPYSVQHKEISVTIKLGLTLERDLL